MISTKMDAKTNQRINFGPLLIEVVLILLAVLLGLVANEWRMARAEEAQAKNALRYIKNELQSNKEQVDKLIPYHSSLRDSLRALGSLHLGRKTNISLTDIRKAMPQGFSSPLLEKTGWELANQTGSINHVDFQIAATLSKLYNLQDFCQGKFEKVADNLYIASNINLKDLSGFTMALALLANDIVIQEERLSKLYAEMIKNLENYTN